MCKNKDIIYNLIDNSVKLTKKEATSILKQYSDIEIFEVNFENEPDIVWLLAKIDQKSMKKIENDKIKQLEQTLLNAINGVESRLMKRLIY
ncbi:hypothetical protein [Mycoplasma elephantis]|uniref:hypothetical protein n=1 Tax=Mycoplasma elephantis TaxID=114882 RepID=UPI000487C1B5|nr:hypothetical protein [Mycoplasma elephantis]